MEKWNWIESYGYADFSNPNIHQTIQQTQRSAKVHTVSLPSISVSHSGNDLQRSLTCSLVIFNNPIFSSNPLSELTPLKPVDTVSIFTGTSGNLAGDQHEVSQ